MCGLSRDPESGNLVYTPQVFFRSFLVATLPHTSNSRIFVPQANLFHAGKSSATVAFFICVLTAWERVAAAAQRKERAAEHPSGEVRCPRRRRISAVPPCIQLHAPWRRLPSRVGDPSPFSRSVAAGLRPAEGSVETPTEPAPGGHAGKPSVRTHARCRRQPFKQFPGSPSSRVAVARKGAGDRNEIFNKSVPQNELSFSILSSGDTLFPLKVGTGAGERRPRAPSPSPQRQAPSLGAPPAADKGQRTRDPGGREGRRLH